MPPLSSRPLFTFAVVTDTHVGAASIPPSAPFPSGLLANDRAHAAAKQIAAYKPAFVVHVGDMVHPVPGQPAFPEAAATFFELFSVIDAPLHCTPGNHDIGDKPMRWLPSRQIAEDCFDVYADAFGPGWKSFEHEGCQFIILNSSLFNSGLPQEAEQWVWLEEALAGAERKFVFLHYPPFIHDVDEVSHYDNIAQPARSRLLGLFDANGVEGVFSGHVHNIFMNRFGNVDLHVLPATAFVRQDYQELFSVKPEDEEFGRNDLARFGFYLVDVFPDGYVTHWIQTRGATEYVGPSAPEKPVLSARKVPSALGVDLRHSWAQPHTMTPTGVVDEFSRKHVRNDYLTMRLNGLGLRKLRVPLTDWCEPETARRIRDMIAFGHTFVFYTFDLPTPEQQASLSKLPHGSSSLEVVLHPNDLMSRVGDLDRLRASIGMPVYLSRLQIHDRTVSSGQHYTRVHHGFTPEEIDEAIALLASDTCPHIDGFALRFERSDALWPAIAEAAERAADIGRKVLVQVRMAGAKAHINHDDDAEASEIAVLATLAASAYGSNLDVFLDTLIDQDRGYMPRVGLLDRRLEPRPAGLAVRTLSEYFARHDAPVAPSVEGGIARFTVGGRDMALAFRSADTDRLEGFSTLIDLSTGASTGIRSASEIREKLQAFPVPVLLAR